MFQVCLVDKLNAPTTLNVLLHLNVQYGCQMEYYQKNLGQFRLQFQPIKKDQLHIFHEQPPYGQLHDTHRQHDVKAEHRWACQEELHAFR